MSSMSSNPPTIPGPQTYAPQDRDRDHLRLLSIFWYISAGLTALGGCVGLFYIGLGAVFLSADVNQSSGDPPPEFVGWGMIGLGGFLLILTALACVLQVMVARSLNDCRRYVLCIVIAALTCLSIPLGTILGVFTFIVLGRPTVKARFDSVRAGR